MKVQTWLTWIGWGAIAISAFYSLFILEDFELDDFAPIKLALTLQGGVLGGLLLLGFAKVIHLIERHVEKQAQRSEEIIKLLRQRNE